MSARTIFEFNHDYAHEIERNPEEFVNLLRRYLGSAGESAAAPLERYGVRLAWWGHEDVQRVLVRDGADCVELALSTSSYPAGLTPEQARYLAQQLIDSAARIERNRW